MDQKCLSAVVAVFLIAASIVAGHEGHHNNQTQTPETINATIVANNVTESKVDSEVQNSYPTDQGTDYFQWNNNDDYQDDIDEPKANNDSSQPTFQKNETLATDPNSSNIENSKQGPKTNVPTISQESQGSKNESYSETNSKPEDQQTNNNDTATDIETKIKNDTISDGETETGPTSDSYIITSTLSEDKQPSEIITEDVGDSYTNFTSVDPIMSEIEERGEGLRAWSVVVVSVLVSFAVIFTILYFIRGALIRNRRMDQRRLLRGSVSSEGYFYGDGGELNTVASKFEF